MVNVLASMFFGGISGSPTADVASLGPIEIEMMDKSGYDRDFSTGLTMSSAIQGLLIPPSHNMVIYCMAAGGVSVGQIVHGRYYSRCISWNRAYGIFLFCGIEKKLS